MPAVARSPTPGARPIKGVGAEPETAGQAHGRIEEVGEPAQPLHRGGNVDVEGGLVAAGEAPKRSRS